MFVMKVEHLLCIHDSEQKMISLQVTVL